ncbi:MAG: FAD-binding oxidoreductase [Candidatus Rokubacteria bacterium]|nr:FAD-binding oxidoreductase [Candidatus Rokubacteria bacterium]
MAEASLDTFRGIVGPANVLTGIEISPYVVEGRTPDAAVFPGSADEVRAVVEAAAASDTPIVPWGGGTAALAGTPAARSGIVLGLRRLARLVEHEPGDLTATAEAGITIAELGRALRARGQWLSLDPPDRERATLGGVIAANASGPRRHLYGTLRDLLIGVTVVTADGAVVRGGGKVVKNVAGYDLPKLFIGAWGTLGIVVEATVRLHPLPEEDRLVFVGFDRLKDAGAAARAVGASDLIPSALDLLDGEAARALGIAAAAAPVAAALVVGFDGLAEQVAWQCDELARLTAPLGGRGVSRPLPEAAWDGLAGAAAAAFETPAAVMRLVVMPAQVAELMEQGAQAARGLPTAWSAHAGVGVVTAALFAADSQPDTATVAGVLGEWRGMARAGAGHAVLEWAPLAVKAALPVWDDAGAAGRIMQRIKAQLDPANLLNPGRFVAGI